VICTRCPTDTGRTNIITRSCAWPLAASAAVARPYTPRIVASPKPLGRNTANVIPAGGDECGVVEETFFMTPTTARHSRRGENNKRGRNGPRYRWSCRPPSSVVFFIHIFSRFVAGRGVGPRRAIIRSCHTCPPCRAIITMFEKRLAVNTKSAGGDPVPGAPELGFATKPTVTVTGAGLALTTRVTQPTGPRSLP
jgi:hypothetical protein